MAQRVRDILLRIRGDASDAENDLHQLARELKAFDSITAEATVDVNTQAAERKVKSAENAVKAFGRMSEEAKVDLQARAAQVKLDGLNRNLDNLQKREVTPKVEIAIGKTVAQIEKVEAQLDRLDRRRVEVNVDVDRSRLGGVAGAVGAGAGAALSGISTAAQGLGLLVSAASRGIPILGGLGQLFIQLGISGAALGPVFLVLVPIIGVALLGAVVMLTGAVGALVASLAAAAAGVAILAGAFAAAMGPVVLVAIAAMARFAKILEAVKQAEDGAAEGAERVRDANRAQADAQRNAADAAGRIRTTAVDAYRAWAQAAEETSDAIRGIAQAELSRDQARLNVEQAEQNLKDLRQEAGLTADSLDGLFQKFTDVDFRPTDLIGAIQKSEVGKQAGAGDLDIAQAILDVRQARLSEQEAIDGVSDAHTRLKEARARENEFIQNGINAYEPYTAAVKANADAQRALKDATDGVNEAQAERNKALKELTPLERQVARTLISLKDTIARAFGPAVRQVFRGVLDALKDLDDFLSDPGIRRSLTSIGRAIGDAFRVMGRELRRREVREGFIALANTGARLVRILSTDVFRSVFRILLRIAVEALPWLERVVAAIGRAMRGLDRDATRSRIRGVIQGIERSFNAWKRVAQDVWDILKLLFPSAKKQGDRLADTIHRILVDFKDWLKQDPEGIENFFRDARFYAEDLLTALEDIVANMEKIIGFIEDAKTSLVGRGDILGEANRPQYGGGTFRRRRALGGLIPGIGTGDHVPILAEPGEFMIRRSVTQAIGVNRLNLLNAGRLGALGGGGRAGMVIQEQIINLPPAPGHDQMGDARHQAVQFARELRRRGGQGIGGGGVQ